MGNNRDKKIHQYVLRKALILETGRLQALSLLFSKKLENRLHYFSFENQLAEDQMLKMELKNQLIRILVAPNSPLQKNLASIFNQNFSSRPEETNIEKQGQANRTD